MARQRHDASPMPSPLPAEHPNAFPPKYTDDSEHSLSTLILTSVMLRAALIVYARFHDGLFNLKYTDVDYSVFLNGSYHVANDGSPYHAAGYRYTPILAWLLLPSLHFLDFGRIVFCTCDVLVGLLIYRIVRRHASHWMAYQSVAVWLLNPLTLIVSTRGNAESLQALLVLGTLTLLQDDHITLAAVLHGFAIHFKLYPIIYLPSSFLYILFRFCWVDIRKTSLATSVTHAITNWRGLCYILLSAVTFLFLAYTFHARYGYEFLYETYLYHFERIDSQHNFAPYFYLFRLGLEPAHISLLAFAAQSLSLLYTAWNYFDDLPFCWFISTVLFVSLNKVCTSQYFLWYLSLLPAALPRLSLNFGQYVFLGLLWLASQALWLFWAYLLEFAGFDVAAVVWLCSLVFLGVNLYIVYTLMQAYHTLGKVLQREKMK